MTKYRKKLYTPDDDTFVGLLVAGGLGGLLAVGLLWLLCLAAISTIVGALIYCTAVIICAAPLTFLQCLFIGLGITLFSRILKALFSRD